MYEGEALKYGPIHKGSGRDMAIPYEIAATQTVKARSGRFVDRDANGRVTIATAASTRLLGWLDAHESSSHPVGTKFGVYSSVDRVYRIPINAGTYVNTMQGDLCDISIASSIQGADLTASAKDHFIIVDGDEVNNKWVDVKMNPSIVGTGAGAEA